MAALGRVLAATDGSDRGLNAIVTAAALAKRAGATLEIVTVAETVILPEAQTPPGVQVSVYEEAFLEEARSRAREQAAEAGVPDATVHVRDGLASRTITEIAEERAADLIVLGAHPRSAISRLLGGSTTERLLRLSRRPVLVAVAARGEPFQRILAPVDLSEQSRHVLEVAGTIAASDGASLRTLFVQEPLPPMVMESEMFDPQAYHRHGGVMLDRVIEETGLPAGLTIDRIVREGRAGERILEAAEEWDADLIVMGSHGFGLFERLILGSTSLHVLRHGHRATIVVPPGTR